MERHQFSCAVEQSPVSILVTDKKGRIEYVNPKFCRVTGYQPDEVIGQTPRILKSGEMSAEHYRQLWQTVQAGGEWRGEFHNRKKNGELYWVSATISPICDGAGDITHFLAVEEDITERKRTAEELVWKTAFLEAQVESTSDGILVVDDQARKILQNKRLFEIFKVPDNIANDECDAQLLRWATNQTRDPEQFARRVRHLYAHPDEVGRDELALLDGTVLERYSAPVRGQDGKYFGRIWAFRDVTQRQQAEDKIREQAALLDKAADAIWVLDAGGCISYWNKGAEALYGWTAAEVIGKPPLEVLRRGTMTPELQQCIDTVLERGEWTGELEEFTKDGKTLIAQVRCKAISDDAGNQKGLLVISTNITERKKLEAQYLRAQRMESVGTLASGIAHDLNNVLTPLLMSVQLLREATPGDEGRRLLDLMEKNVERGANLVKQVLTFGRGAAGEQVPLSPVASWAKSGKSSAKASPNQSNLPPTSRPNSGTSTATPPSSTRSLLNLCVNARDAMPDGGLLLLDAANAELDDAQAQTMAGAKPGRYVVIKVADTGTGMTREVQDRIVEPFFTTKGIGKGTGLGLATSLGIVKGHDGFIHCASECGKGTTFSIYLPSITLPVAKTGLTQPHLLPRGHDELVLVVDDEAAIRQATSELLEHFGYRVLRAANGAEAVSLYASRPGDIAAVLTDMSMPIKDGAEEIVELRAINPKVKIIAASGLNDNHAPALDGVRDHFIAKPYTTDTLLHTLDDVLHEDNHVAEVAEEASFNS